MPRVTVPTARWAAPNAHVSEMGADTSLHRRAPLGTERLGYVPAATAGERRGPGPSRAGPSRPPQPVGGHGHPDAAAGGAAHLRSWPPRWACARRGPWRGSSRRLLAAPRGAVTGGHQRQAAARPLAHSFLPRPLRPRAGGERAPPGGAGPKEQRERRLRAAGRVGVAGSREAPQATDGTDSPPPLPPPRLPRNRKPTLANQLPEKPESKQRGGEGGHGGERGCGACAVPAAPSGGGRPAVSRSRGGLSLRRPGRRC